MIMVGRSAELKEPSKSMIGLIDCEPRIATQGFGSSPRHVDPLKAMLGLKTNGKQRKGGYRSVGIRVGQFNNRLWPEQLPGLMGL